MSGEEAAFDNFDVDFDKVQRRRQQYLARKAAERGEPLLTDPDGTNDDKQQQQQQQQAQPVQQGRFAGIGRLLTGRNAVSSADSNATPQLNATQEATSHETPTTANASVAQVPKKAEREAGFVGVFGGKRVIRWPYDDYHEVQKQYYTKLEELEESEGKSPEDPVSNTATRRGFFGFGARVDAHSVESSNKPQNQASNLQRPDDPPDIPTAVQGLPLSDFERKAEERAIGIVSTWLFDCGLIDELLVHGGMGKSTMRTAENPYSHADDNNSKASNATKVTADQQGIEIGEFGHVLEGPSKMDKEIAKLRGGTARQLTMVNARLNDGVAASGGEVQELVNAVNSTKDDLGRLRELSTYIGGLQKQPVPDDGNTVGGEEITIASSASSMVQNSMMARSQTFMLTKYPKLKKAINARRNLARCFRELDFYSQIPLTCDRLREDLHQAEWTETEWSSLREVSREHVELEIFLVEAESGMKKRIEEEIAESRRREINGGLEDDPYDTSRRAHLQRTERSSSRNNKISSATLGRIQNYEEVDNFLSEHVKNVWELGDEIRMRIMSGIGGAFDLATTNPAGLVALVEAVEVYEAANEEYKSVHGEEAGSASTRNLASNETPQNLRFTDMRASALKQLYQDFELRALDVFREVHEEAQGRDIEYDDEEKKEYFTAILRAANELTGDIVFVQNQMSPCFPPNWGLEMLWTTCVAHVCSKQISEQIGGREGHRLPEFETMQLLDLVAWIESFRSTIEESFPNIKERISEKTYFDKRPDLLQENNRHIDMDVAKDSLAWANNMLWEVHDLAKDEFLLRSRDQADGWLDNAYSAEHQKDQTSEGRLMTSLCEDVYGVVGVQVRTIQERLTRQSEALATAVGLIFKKLYDKQIESRNKFLLDFETCCAASNDFIRMSEHCEEILADLVAECNLSEGAQNILEEQCGVLLGLYSGDAVFAAQKIHVYVFEPIEESISGELFGEEWVTELTANELALTLVKTLEDFIGDLEVFLDELMVGKTLDALVTATVIFYFKYLLKKASDHKSAKNSVWSDVPRALQRIRGDIDIMKGYFEDLVDAYPTLKRAISEQFEILDTVHELLSIASGMSQSSDRDFVILLQKRIRNIPLTKLVVGDLWHLVNPAGEVDIYEQMDVLETELNAVAPNDSEAYDVALARQTVPGLRLDQELARLCDSSKRSRPGYGRTASEQGQIMLQKWRNTWQNLVEQHDLEVAEA